MRVRGEVRPPGDKSITHRALMLAGAIRGTSVVHRPLTCADARSTAGCLRSLGVRVSPLQAGSVVRIEGRRWHAPDGTLHCGNSGTTARLLLGFLLRATSRLSESVESKDNALGSYYSPLHALNVMGSLPSGLVDSVQVIGKLFAMDAEDILRRMESIARPPRQP